ncbi:ABC transporter permease [Nocardia pseudobrasiliensis]|uniref:ABC-2 type transport system permease protein n=1 Tax=Nocardia pseudobrasiliensis TaxID=45979 RepID=A0A370HZY6_9NOCA|nr:ABC transporter permease [Nocardia pseudobrasiliensis]RDI64028.1 ABC-2 type transport system permease protein [Nocardia pseudobrasiliensis]
MTTTTLDRFGGFSPEFLTLELRRMLRNKRTGILALLMPAVVFVAVGTQSSLRDQAYGSGNLTGYMMVSMAVYGAMFSTATGGATVAIERAFGWSRQLRLTPLRPAAYVATKVMVSMMLGLLSVTSVFVLGAIFGARLSPVAWVACFVLAWVGSLVFAAFGLLLGYLLPSENVMQVLGLAVAALGFGGGLFIKPGGWFEIVSRIFPTSGIATLARLPFGEESPGSVALAVLNVVVWTTVFAGGAAYLFRRDTAR